METKSNTNLNEETVLKSEAAQPEQTKAENKPSDKKGGASAFWKTVVMGGIPGILLGTAGTLPVEDAFAQPAAEEDADHFSDGTGGGTSEQAEINVAHSVNDDMPFGQAFAAARAEVGPGGAFVWHGQVYGTYRADDPEWQQMSQEERIEHSQQILSQVHGTPYNPSEEEVNEHADNTNADNNTDVSGGENGENDEVDVHVVGVGQIVAEDGSTIDAGYGEVDGHSAVFADIDGDGEIDTVMIDHNDDGQVDIDEVYDTQGYGITSDMLAQEAEINNADTLDDHLYDGMPDYTNDADTSSLV